MLPNYKPEVRGVEAILTEEKEASNQNIIIDTLLSGLDFMGAFMVAVRMVFFVLFLVLVLDRILNYIQ